MAKMQGAKAIAIVLVCFAFLLFAAPALVGWPADETSFMDRNQGPVEGHPLGTDSMGRDNIARVLAGGQLSVLIGASGMLCALAVGGVLGLAACAMGGIVEGAYYGFIDLLRSMPGPLLAISLVVSLGQGIGPVVIALGFIYSPMFARIARALYRREAEMEYVAFSRANGAGSLAILVRHILPNVAGAFLTQATIVYPRAIVTESVLSFLGMGVPPEVATWGKIISIESGFFEDNPIAVIVPVVFLSAFTALFALLGTRLREAS
jgi:ABC-type dipeptide/oligopeptide/nickel transport system permease subunit